MLVVRVRVAVLALLVVALAVVASPASASSPYLVIPPKAEAEASAAYRYAAMTSAQAFAELDRRGVPYRRVAAMPGVRAPVRLTGKLHGVDIHGALPKAQRASSHFEVLDARFALTLDDFARLLAKHDIVELVHFTMYRPNGPKPGSAADKRYRQWLRDQARKARGRLPRRSRRRPTKVSKGIRTRKGQTAKRTSRTSRRSRKGHGVPTAAPAVHKQVAPRKGVRPKGKRPHSQLWSPAASRWASANDVFLKHDEQDALFYPGAAARRRAPASKAKSSGAKSSNAKRRWSKKRRQGKTRYKVTHKKLWSPPGTRHPAGLAIDVGVLLKRDGTRLSVAQHFHGRIGAASCGAGAVVAKSWQARELRSIVCEARDLGLFTYVLTPNYNRDHADHFHMEIRPGVRWFLYH